jgi:glycosyltransferase involved in cell wall biosynthesis
MIRRRMLSVTVVITNYNHGEYLRQAVDSVLGQTRPADRVLLIDDGSTDRSSAVLDGLPSSVEVIRQRNSGVVAARNRALNLVSTSHVVFLDADNYLLPQFLRWSLAAWRLPHGSQLGFVYSPARVYTADASGYMHTKPWSAAELARQNYVDNTALMVRNALEDVGGYSEAFAELGHEDWNLFLTMAERGWTGRMIPIPLFCYRSKADSRNFESLKHGDAVRAKLTRLHPWMATPELLAPPRVFAGRVLNLMQTLYRSWDARTCHLPANSRRPNEGFRP